MRRGFIDVSGFGMGYLGKQWSHHPWRVIGHPEGEGKIGPGA